MRFTLRFVQMESVLFEEHLAGSSAGTNVMFNHLKLPTCIACSDI